MGIMNCVVKWYTWLVCVFWGTNAFDAKVFFFLFFLLKLTLLGVCRYLYDFEYWDKGDGNKAPVKLS